MVSPALGPPTAVETERGLPDVLGVLLLGCCVGWALVSAAGRDARPEGTLLAVLALAAGYAFGRMAGALLPAGAPALAALGCLACVGWTRTARGPGLGPAPLTDGLGRLGADSALLVLAVGAACCAAWSAGRRSPRVALWLLAVAGVVVSALVGPPGGTVAALAALLWALAAGRLRRRTAALAALAAVGALAAAGAWAVASGALPAGLVRSLAGPLGESRVQLWQDALATAREHPLLGAGPGAFTAPDAGGVEPAALVRATAHSAPLQLAAEQGLPGLALLGAVYGWLLLALRASPRPTPVVLSAAGALTAVAVLACAGNALSFTQVTAGAALLAGAAGARRLS